MIAKPTSGSEVQDWIWAETEGLINEAQDQILPTKSYFARIVKDMTLKSTQDM